MMDIESFLKRTDMSQTKLAQILGVTPGSITKWKNGGGVDLAYLDHLLRLGMNIEEMFTQEAWETVKRLRAEEFRDQVELTPEECARIVQAGMQKMREQGHEIVALRRVQDQAEKG